MPQAVSPVDETDTFVKRISPSDRTTAIGSPSTLFVTRSTGSGQSMWKVQREHSMDPRPKPRYFPATSSLFR